MSMINPYENVDWGSAEQIVTTTHDHVYDTHVATPTKQHFENLYNGGVRCFAVSNYYPSAPMYPLSDWTEELGRDVPGDIIEIPNAEHHNLAFDGNGGNSIHMNSIGSMFRSGQERGLSPSGYAGGRVEDLIRDILGQMLYEDGGGITVNHPTWTHNQNLFSMDILTRILDMDERVLGIEIFSTTLWDTELWDQILMSGRRCWGFAVPDHYHKSHAEWYGRNVLVVPEKTQHECLKAIRNGNMYCKYANTGLKFTGISMNGKTMTVRTNAPCTIRFIADGAVMAETAGTASASYDAVRAGTYVRAEAETEGDRLLTQPVLFSTQAHRHGRKMWRL